jgi:hypothetical protein
MEKAPFVTFLSKKILLPSSTMPLEQYSYSTVRRLAISHFYRENILMPSSMEPYHRKNILALLFVACTIVFFYSIFEKLYLLYCLPPILDEENTIAFFYSNVRKNHHRCLSFLGKNTTVFFHGTENIKLFHRPVYTIFYAGKILLSPSMIPL